MAPSVAALLQEASQLHRQGRLSDAERRYQAALAQQPRNFDALHLLGMLRMQQGRVAEAADLVSAAVEQKPGAADALTLLASIMVALQRFDQALDCLDRVLKLRPNDAEARFNRGVVLAQAERLPEALAAYDQVVAAAPNHGEAWFNRGNVLAQLARYQEAVASYDRALSIAPAAFDAHNNRGNALALLGRHDGALASFERALQIRPDDTEALNNRATALHALGRHAEALIAAERALALRPGHANALVTRGNILRALERMAEALASYDRALVARPHDIEIINNRGLCLIAMERADEALPDAERAVARDPSNPAVYYGRGNVLEALARDEEAIRDYRKAIALRPDYAEAHFNLAIALQMQSKDIEAAEQFDRALALQPGMPQAKWKAGTCHLSLGHLVKGAELFEARCFGPHAIRSIRQYPRPRWNGSYLPGVLLISGEQGVGDQVLPASMLPDLKGRAEKIVVEVDHRLVGLFNRSFPHIETIGLRPELYSGRIDAHEPMGSLLRHLRPSFDAFPRRERGYLVPDAERVRALRNRLAADGRPVIGLSWISRNKKWEEHKSAQLADFAAMLRAPGFRFIDLQYGDTTEERAAVERDLGVRIERLADVDNMNDLDGLSALISACDAVLSVSNTNAHLAGAVGAPTWVIPPAGRGHVWYWFIGRSESPWYPRLQVRRRAPDQSWSELVAKVTEEIAEAVRQPRPA